MRHSLNIPELSTPAVLSDYTLVQRLGKGAYATVAKAKCNLTGELFAVKSYSKKNIKLALVHNEVEALQSLDHPNIVKFKAIHEDSTHIHLVMEYVDGVLLSEFVKQFPQNRVSEHEAQRLFAQLVQAVAYFHASQIVHRDLKLENVMVDSSQCIKVVDFGFASIRNGSCWEACGTPAYMAPEILARPGYNGQAADVWALGVMLFAMLTGALPFAGTSEKETQRRILSGALEVPHNLPLHVRVLIKKVLHLNPRVRPRAADLLNDDWIANGRIPAASKRALKRNFTIGHCSSWQRGASFRRPEKENTLG